MNKEILKQLVELQGTIDRLRGQIKTNKESQIKLLKRHNLDTLDEIFYFARDGELWEIIVSYDSDELVTVQKVNSVFVNGD